MLRVLPPMASTVASSSLVHLAAASSRALCFSPASIGATLPISRFVVSSVSPAPSRRALHLASAESPITVLPRREAILHSQLFGIEGPRLFRKKSYSGIEASAARNMTHASTAVSQAGTLEWVKQDRRRLLHVVYRVGDVEKTIKFYKECLGMKLLRKRDIPEERYTDAFLGYGPED